MFTASAGREDAPPVVGTRSETRKLTDIFSIKSWGTEAGLPRNTINCLLQTSDGYLWIGTRNGLARFDGVSFMSYGRENTRELPHNNVLSLAEHPPGTLWIGTYGGVARYTNHKFFRHAIGTPKPNRVWSIVPRQAGGVWLGTDYGPAYLTEAEPSSFAFFPALSQSQELNFGGGAVSVYRLIEARTNCLWFLDQQRVARLPKGAAQFQLIHPPGGNLPIPLRGQGLLEDREGAIWFATPAGLYRWRNDRLDHAECEAIGFHGVPGPLSVDHRGGIWLRNGDAGLAYLFAGKFTHYATPTGMSDDNVNCLLPDREGNIWVGTDRGGLNRLQPRHLINLTVEDGLPDDEVWSISQGPDGALWVGSEAGVSCYRDGRFTTCTSAGGNRHETSYLSQKGMVAVNTNGEVFVGNDNGLCQVRSNTLVPVFRNEGGTNFSLPVSTIYCDRSGRLWVGSRNRIYCRQESGWEPVVDKDGKPRSFPTIVALLEDAHQAIWAGTIHGVFRLQGGACQKFTPAEGFPAEYAGPALADPDGTVWFASDRGLIRYRNGRFFLFTQAHGLFERLVLNVLEDECGWFWLNGHQGLQRVPRSDLNAVADRKARSLECMHYGEADGMLSAEGNGGSLPNSCKAADGRLWFPTTKGVVVVNPRSIVKNKIPPPVVIEQVVANGEFVCGDPRSEIYEAPAVPEDSPTLLNLEPAKSHRFGPGKARTLLIHYTANSLMSPERVRFQYRLDGHDASWIDDRARLRTAIYTNLRPGRYRFRVRAFNNHGVQSLAEAVFPFSVAPHFYETWTFYILCGCTVLLCAVVVHDLRLNALRRIKTLEQLHALDQERSRLARDMHDNLGADLTRVMMLAQLGAVGPGAERRGPPDTQGNGYSSRARDDRLARIAGLSRSMVDGIGELVWATNPQKNRLDDVVAYLRARSSEILEPAGVSVRYDFPAQFPDRALSGEIRRQLLLAMKEALTNVLKHSRATVVTLTLRAAKEGIVLAISDNGCGFSGPGISASGGGNGLGNMRSRIEGVGGTYTVHSEPGHGTTIALQVPFGPEQPVFHKM